MSEISAKQVLEQMAFDSILAAEQADEALRADLAQSAIKNRRAAAGRGRR